MASADATLDLEWARWIRGWWLRVIITLAALLGGAMASMELLTCARMAWGAWRLPGAMEELREVNPPPTSTAKPLQPWAEAKREYHRVQKANGWGQRCPHIRGAADLKPDSQLRNELAAYAGVFATAARPRKGPAWVRTYDGWSSIPDGLGVVGHLEWHHLNYKHRVMNRMLELLQILATKTAVAGLDEDLTTFREMLALLEQGFRECEELNAFAGEEWKEQFGFALQSVVIDVITQSNTQSPSKEVLWLLREMVLRQAEKPSSLQMAIEGERRMLKARAAFASRNGAKSQQAWISYPSYLQSEEWLLSLHIIVNTGGMDGALRALADAAQAIENGAAPPRFAAKTNTEVSWASPSYCFALDKERYLCNFVAQRLGWRIALAALDSTFYRKQNGAWPAHLSDLDCAGSHREDPFAPATGKLKLAVQPDTSLCIWSVGVNQQDDGFAGDDIGCHLPAPDIEAPAQENSP